MRCVSRTLVTGWSRSPRPAGGWAQSGIAGVVRDATAVLPGVTVEAASPALIEKVQTAVTDSQGRDSIIELRLGIYTITFTLTGFNTVRREDIDVDVGAAVPIPDHINDLTNRPDLEPGLSAGDPYPVLRGN